MADISILIEILRFFINMEADASAKKIFSFRTNCVVHVCMGLYEVSQCMSSETFGGAGKTFGSWRIICLRRINIVSDFYVHQEREKTK